MRLENPDSNVLETSEDRISSRKEDISHIVRSKKTGLEIVGLWGLTTGTSVVMLTSVLMG